jgi:O-antigen ligase
MHVLLGSRSLAVFTILAFVLTLNKRSINRVTIAKIFLTCIVLIGLIFGIERTYYNLATKGAFGQSQQIKSLDQYNAGPILFTARSEIAFELAAIKSNPIIGSGSNPNITFQILNDAQLFNQFLGVTTDATNAYKAALSDGKIPQHSVILSAWIEGGIVLAVYWIIIIFWTLRKFGEILRTKTPLSQFAIYIGLSSI